MEVGVAALNHDLVAERRVEAVRVRIELRVHEAYNGSSHFVVSRQRDLTRLHLPLVFPSEQPVFNPIPRVRVAHHGELHELLGDGTFEERQAVDARRHGGPVRAVVDLLVAEHGYHRPHALGRGLNDVRRAFRRLGVHVNLSNLEHQHRVPIVRYVTEGDETVEEALVLLRSLHVRRDRELSVAREGRRLHVEAGRRHEVHGLVEGLRRARAEGPLARRLGQVQQRVDTHE
mmetsp:Transcript_26639/g.54891  ORF Transcript_26639/g.54891 Transcript_26639/m.54891 type:complete len:231 (-) Transcript_26639:425-1117(-)